jgi:hypothetical protein
MICYEHEATPSAENLLSPLYSINGTYAESVLGRKLYGLTVSLEL